MIKDYKISFDRDRKESEKYAPYSLVTENGDLICTMYGGASAMLMEMLCQLLDRTNPKYYPSPRDFFYRYDQQEGITWKIYRPKDRPHSSSLEIVKFQNGKMVEIPHWFNENVEYEIEDVK